MIFLSDVSQDLMEMNYLFYLLNSSLEGASSTEFKKAKNKVIKVGIPILKNIAKKLGEHKFTVLEELLFFDMIQRNLSSKYYEKYGGVPVGRVDFAYA